MERLKLTDEQIGYALEELAGWQMIDGKLHKQFKFRSFAEALGWMVAVGTQAEKMDHHPEWSNVYSRVTVDLVTHNLGNAISSFDVELARRMNALAGSAA